MKTWSQKRVMPDVVPARGYWRSLLVHFIYFCGIAFLTATLSVFVGWVGGTAIALLLWLTSIAWFPELARRLLGNAADVHWLAMLMALVTVVGTSSNFPVLLTLLKDDIPTVRASQIPEYPDTSGFRLSDGEVRTEFAHLRTVRSYNSRRSTTTTSHVRVAPLTDAMWSKDQPVAAWVVCLDFDALVKRCPHWGSRNASAVAYDGRNHAVALDAIREAAQQHGLNLPSSVRLLQWEQSIGGATQRRVAAVLASTLGVYLVWMPIFSIGFWRRKNREV